MSYTKTTWTNGSGAKINETNLNKIEQGIYDNDSAIGNINNLETTSTDLVGAVNEINNNLPIVLYNSTTGESGSVELSDNKSNYTYIEIFAKSNGGGNITQKIITSDNQLQLCAIDDNGMPTQSKLWLKWGKYTFGNTTITPVYQGWTEILSNPSTTFTTTNFGIIKIYKVLGYK